MKIKLLSLALLSITGLSIEAKTIVWTPSSNNEVTFVQKVKDVDVPKTSLIYHIDFNAFKSSLINAPLRGKSNAKTSNVIVSFPNAKGELEQYRIEEAPIMHPDLAARYPEIKSYVGYGVNTPSKIRFSTSPQKGLSGMILGVGTTVFIEPYTADFNYYAIYTRNDDNRIKTFECLTEDFPHQKVKSKSSDKNANDQTLRTFELAMSATGEFTAYHGGTKAGALAAMNATMTRVNGVYETDFAITMILIPNTDTVIFTNSSTDPYTNNLNSQLQSTLTSYIGEANYDIGHLVHQESNSNGNAGCIGCVCVNGQKGSAFTSHVTPQGDYFDIDYVAHEMGHQFGGNHTHTYNWFPEFTGAQMEPGSGSTIMGYAGITGPSDVQAHSDAYFHYFNIEQIITYVTGTNCQVNTPITNSVPVVNAGLDYTIPHSTAYVLEGWATDADAGDFLTYCWEQGDEGFQSQTSVTSSPTLGMSPTIRSLPPDSVGWRFVPMLSSVIAGNLTTQWETVLTQGGTMNMSLTVRDNAAGAGQNSIDKMVVTVDGNSGPFEVTSQSTNVTWSIGSQETITWNVANTTAPPVSTPNVDVKLSLDGGYNYPYTLAAGVPNNGSATITVPWSSTTNQAIIMVRGTNNIFYALNSSDFTIISPTGIDKLNGGTTSIYPNPANDVLNIEFTENTHIELITITDVHGKLVYTNGNINFTKTKIDISNFANGLYVLKLQTNKETIVHKVTKQ